MQLLIPGMPYIHDIVVWNKLYVGPPIIENNDTMSHLAGRGLSLALDRSVIGAGRISSATAITTPGNQGVEVKAHAP